MKVISNTFPIAYLVLIGYIDLLPALFGSVSIPKAVQVELTRPGAPDMIRQRIASPPIWLTLEAVMTPADQTLIRLHPGEREVILLAQQLKADLVIPDDKAVRQVAQEQGLNITGLLGVLGTAAEWGLVDLPVAVERLRQTSFRASPRVLKALLDRYHR
ncbi:MAG: DUF3368 domain-containing protein [Anaerolineae bacterium]|nr:DUF3368 domain-containing protein [Anaerolineae bacterium]